MVRKTRRMRPRRGRKKFNRKYRIPRAIGNPRQKVYYYNRNVNLRSCLALTDGTDYLDTFTFKLDDVSGYTDFTNLYDFYKIKAIKMRFIPQFTGTQALYYDTGANLSAWKWPGSNVTPSCLRIFTCIDYNDATVPTNINSMRQYANCKYSIYTKGHKRYFKPQLNVVSEDGANIQYGNKSPWVSCADAATQEYFSIKVGIDTSLLPAATIALNDVLCRIECVYYMAFKAPI